MSALPSRPWEPKWEEDFGFVADKYPMIATEFGGFASPNTSSSTNAPAAGRFAPSPEYGPDIIKYLEGKGISWTVWCFDPEWGPSLLRNWDFQLSSSGDFAKAAMAGEIK